MKNHICSLFFFAMLMTISTTAFAQKKLKGEGPIVEQKLQLENFEEMGLALNATVYFKLGSTQSVLVKGQQNIIDALNKEVKNNSWNIRFEDRYQKGNWNSDYEAVEIFVTMTGLDVLSVAGGGTFMGDGRIQVEDLEVNIAGGGKVEITGSVEDLELNVAGGGKADLDAFEAEEAEVNVAGGGSAFVHVSGTLEANVAGGGKVRYAGNPEKVEKSSVFGSIKPMD